MNDKEVVLAAVNQNGYSLSKASEELRNDKEVVLEEGLKTNVGDEIRVRIITRFKTFENSEIILEGYDYRNAIKKM